MKTWKLIVVLVIIIVLVGVGILYEQGYLQNFEWQTATMLFAALAGPYKSVSGWLRSDKAEEIDDKHQTMRAEEKKHREETDLQLMERKKQIAELDTKLELLDTKLALLEEKRTKVKTETQSKSLTDLQQEGQALLGEG